MQHNNSFWVPWLQSFDCLGLHGICLIYLHHIKLNFFWGKKKKKGHGCPQALLKSLPGEHPGHPHELPHSWIEAGSREGAGAVANLKEVHGLSPRGFSEDLGIYLWGWKSRSSRVLLISFAMNFTINPNMYVLTQQK